MKQDCTVSQSTADETKRFQTIDNNESPEGTHVSEPDNTTGSEIKMCSQVNRKAKAADVKDNCTSWSYLFPDFVTQKCPFRNWLINNILYLCIPLFWGTQKVF